MRISLVIRSMAVLGLMWFGLANMEGQMGSNCYSVGGPTGYYNGTCAVACTTYWCTDTRKGCATCSVVCNNGISYNTVSCNS